MAIAAKEALGYRSHDELISFTEYKRLTVWLQYTQTVGSGSDCTLDGVMSLKTKTVASLSTLAADGSDSLKGRKAAEEKENEHRNTAREV